MMTNLSENTPMNAFGTTISSRSMRRPHRALRQLIMRGQDSRLAFGYVDCNQAADISGGGS
jgi:hypothetical protein